MSKQRVSDLPASVGIGGGYDRRCPLPGRRDDIAGPPEPEVTPVDEKGLAILTPEEIKAYRDAGFEIDIDGGGITGNLRRK